MRTPAEWNRTYGQMTAADFVSIPRYDLKSLTTPMAGLTNPIKTENIPMITAKLFYSTRFFGIYDLDAGEFTGTHAGVDLKLARGTPVGAIAGGRVAVVTQTQRLGLHVIIEHRLRNGETYYSIYGHFDSVPVKEGQDITPGQTVGLAGMTGNTSSPHVHLQVDKGVPGERHIPYEGPLRSNVLNPIAFIREHSEKE
jgi:murein DD-endopeptidase MepM/ murein hydrolase activator NlpD